ncbi:hypothetical protein THAOC_36803 [Thalassiosira oceanica]|uniref:Uncharacterized protein n=1 Tax=Thalassiosira oceanica TaxID=159749 RepID=K0R1A4_THAOC|nr:hypothetical protein THAOC_36803 [Thalassiosira oceanica]|eukprot:EJK44644.1 hypothetical protein THAOC_36803 [Thalassiosira oceanica]
MYCTITCEQGNAPQPQLPYSVQESEQGTFDGIWQRQKRFHPQARREAGKQVAHKVKIEFIIQVECRLTMGTNDFYSSAMEAFSRQMSTASQGAPMPSTLEEHARAVVEEAPKIDSAVKAFLSLVAARSAVASDIDVLPAGPSGRRMQCTFVGTSIDANRSALLCARTMLATINSTLIIPESPETLSNANGGQGSGVGRQEEKERTSVTRVIWNSLVKQQSAELVNAEKKKQMKPSKVFGRRSLAVAYPFIRERFRRGVAGSDDATSGQKRSPVESLSDDLPAVEPPNGIHSDHWIAFYTEFGDLLSEDGSEQDGCSANDSKLLWSMDRGQKELELRREKRAQRVKDALSSTCDAKTASAE